MRKRYVKRDFREKTRGRRGMASSEAKHEVCCVLVFSGAVNEESFGRHSKAILLSTPLPLSQYYYY